MNTCIAAPPIAVTNFTPAATWQHLHALHLQSLGSAHGGHAVELQSTAAKTARLGAEPAAAAVRQDASFH